MDGFTQSLFDQIGGRPKLIDLLRHFYADVRQHDLIGPIFKAHIDDWPTHIEKIADFWSGLTGGPAQYRGGMAWKHLALNLEEAHFEAWLGLWKRTCHKHLSASKAEDMAKIADQIGMRLRTIIANNRNQIKPEDSHGLGQM